MDVYNLYEYIQTCFSFLYAHLAKLSQLHDRENSRETGGKVGLSLPTGEDSDFGSRVKCQYKQHRNSTKPGISEVLGITGHLASESNCSGNSDSPCLAIS